MGYAPGSRASCGVPDIGQTEVEDGAADGELTQSAPVTVPAG